MATYPLRRPLHIINISSDVRKKYWYVTGMFPYFYTDSAYVGISFEDAVLRNIQNEQTLNESFINGFSFDDSNLRSITTTYNLEINNIIVSVGFEDAVLKELLLKGYNDENTNVVFSFGDGVLSNAKINSYSDSQIDVGFFFNDAVFTV